MCWVCWVACESLNNLVERVLNKSLICKVPQLTGQCRAGVGLQGRQEDELVEEHEPAYGVPQRPDMRAAGSSQLCMCNRSLDTWVKCSVPKGKWLWK